MQMEQEEHEQRQIKEAYESCRQVVQHASKTFYLGSLFLPPPKRESIWAIYAFCRRVDDIVDEASGKIAPRVGHLNGAEDPKRELDRWREGMMNLYQRGGSDENFILRAWSSMLEEYDVPLEPALDLLNGVEMDLSISRYETFEQLHLYCYRVAGTVGLLTSPIFGYRDKQALPLAVELGIALQLTNILRDIGEDAARDRIYLPMEDMRRFGYTETELMNGVINESFRQLVLFEMSRANEYYHRAKPGIDMLNLDCQLAVRLSSMLYSGILDRIHINQYNVFTKRASVPLKNKLAALSHCWVVQQMQNMGERVWLYNQVN